MLITKEDTLYALCGMVLQFAYKTTFCKKYALTHGGLSALELAFSVLEQNGLKINSNGTIQVAILLAFMEEQK